MNLHAIASSYIAAVNPFIVGTIKVSTGSTTSPDGTQIPSYSTLSGVSMQIQALAAKDIDHLDSLNIQNVTRKAWLNGNIEGLNRVAGKGGDLLIFNGQTWLVTVVFETWDADGWCSVGITEQVTP